MTNWPEQLATDVATYFDDVPVYSNVDPTREYNGGKTIEFNVQGFETTPLLSGGVYYDFQLVAACRAPSYSEAAELVEDLRDKLGSIIATYVQTNAIEAGLFTSQEVTADARGLIEGESFYGLLNFTISEKEGL